MPACRHTRRRFSGLALLLILLVGPGSAETAKLLTAGELAALEQENRMWRLMKTEDDVADNLRRLRAAGYGAPEIDLFRAKLEQLWTVESERNLGWLNVEAVEKIQEVDREFIARMRAARMLKAVGIQAGNTSATISEVNRQWRQAVLQVLDYDELAEFRLVNSNAAREVGRLLKGIPLATGEERRLFQLERDFRLAYEPGPMPGLHSRDPHQREARLDHLAAIRESLGDDRFAVYLDRADPEFGDMRTALAGVGAEDVLLALELWRVRQKHAITRSRLGGKPGVELDREVQAAAMSVLGEERFQRYAQDENSRWLFSVRRGPRTAGKTR